jgi:hypothetical protein
MPADPSGVTTDDQRPRGNEVDDPSPAQTAGRTAPSPTVSVAADGRGSHGDGLDASGDPVAPTATAANDSAGSVSETVSVTTRSTSVDTAVPGGDAGVAGGTAGDSGPAGWPDPVPDPTAQATTTLPEPGVAAPVEGEPPPPPVLTGGADAPAAGRAPGRGRHASARVDRASRRGLRVNQRLWSIDPWSVFKVSVLFYLSLGLIVLVAGTLLYNVGRRVGTIDQAESFVTRMGAYGECTPKADVEEGVEFEEDDDKCEEGEVLVGGFDLDDGTLFRTAAIGGTVLVVAGSIGNLLLTVLLNLLNELTGGLRHTVVKEPVARPSGNRAARAPTARRRAPTGSPARRRQG